MRHASSAPGIPRLRIPILFLSAAFVISAQAGATAAVKVSCSEIGKALRGADAAGRTEVARAALQEKCEPMPRDIAFSIRQGMWSDGVLLEEGVRASLVALAIASEYSEAETLAVTAMETGAWPNGTGLSLEDGGQLIRGLKTALTPYRVRLLLDVYEQQEVPSIRAAVLESLRESPLDEALLPAVEAYWQESGAVQVAGLATLKQQPDSPPEVLERLIRTLPDGPLLEWALELGERHPSEGVTAAVEERKAQLR